MKNIILKTIVAIFCITGFGLVSCSDSFTDLEPLGTSTYANFWKTEQDAEKAANSMYYYMTNENYFGDGWMWHINASDDMITGRTKADADNIKNFFTTGAERESGIRHIYRYSYRIIRRANDVLLNVPGMDFNEAAKNRILGEAYFMRAFSNFWNAYHYGDDKSGGVPIITTENMFDPAGTYSRPASVLENYAQIIEDLNMAVNLLPLFTDYSSEDYGRAHRDVALAYIAKTYLYWAYYDSSKYADAVAACDAVTNSGSGRALINTGNPAMDYRLLHSAQTAWSSEYIWTSNSSEQSGCKTPGIMLEKSGWGEYNGWGYFQPTLELYDEFEEGDVRREVTILKFGDEFQYFGATKFYQSTNSQTGFQFNKYMYEYQIEDPVGNTVGPKQSTDYNVPIFRYAEILLIKAEALLMQGQNGDAPINLVRARAGLPPVTNATMDDLKHERRVELAGEFADRHFDLVRWGDAQATYSQPLHGRIHDNLEDPNSPFTVQEVWPARSFNPSYMNVWPIPNDSVESSGIPQNAGW